MMAKNTKSLALILKVRSNFQVTVTKSSISRNTVIAAKFISVNLRKKRSLKIETIRTTNSLSTPKCQSLKTFMKIKHQIKIKTTASLIFSKTWSTKSLKISNYLPTNSKRKEKSINKAQKELQANTRALFNLMSPYRSKFNREKIKSRSSREMLGKKLTGNRTRHSLGAANLTA